VNTVELLQFSLKNAFDILGSVTADLTQEQADWLPPGTANPIGATYWHVISGTDLIVHGWCMGQAPLSQTAGWQDKVVLAGAPEEETDHPAKMRDVRVDLAAMHEYARDVAEATGDWLATVTPEDLERKMDTPVGERNLGQLLVTFGAWHINAHCGEISALKGCQGARGYPF
jgi:hypothetical protein